MRKNNERIRHLYAKYTHPPTCKHPCTHINIFTHIHVWFPIFEETSTDVMVFIVYKNCRL